MPSFSIPSEIFDHLRRDLREQSGITSYDPNDLSSPGLRPYESCIAGVDPSPPNLRCKNCKGRLLRGFDSEFCIFCGEELFLDAIPDPLNFRDSKGYDWLLEALGLDGSESAVPISEEDRPYRKKNKVKGEIRLSDLLSLEIKWSVPQEEKPTTGSNCESPWPKSSLNLGGFDPDEFIGEEITGAEAEREQGDDLGSRVSESNIVPAPDSLSLFGNVRPSSNASNSTGSERGDSMSPWVAEFQLEDSETPRESDQIQKLMSQIHDISFMLDSNLSSPRHSGKPHALEK